MRPGPAWKRAGAACWRPCCRRSSSPARRRHSSPRPGDVPGAPCSSRGPPPCARWPASRRPAAAPWRCCRRASASAGPTASPCCWPRSPAARRWRLPAWTACWRSAARRLFSPGCSSTPRISSRSACRAGATTSCAAAPGISPWPRRRPGCCPAPCWPRTSRSRCSAAAASGRSPASPGSWRRSAAPCRGLQAPWGRHSVRSRRRTSALSAGGIA